jgi:hypothetical protein
MLNFSIAASPVDRAMQFMARNPNLANSLPPQFRRSPQHLVSLLTPVFTAPQRCRAREYYIQAVAHEYCHFLTTNLVRSSSISTTATGQCWLLGRSKASAFPLSFASISRFHAVLGICRDRGFYLLDLDSYNGTYLNQQRLPPRRKHFLQDGDIIHLSHIQFKFLIANCDFATSYDDLTQPCTAA